ncbi:MAG: GatB/YqeY domain-containing protein [Streptosporangiales bacterium]
MASLKERLHADLTAAMKQRDDVRRSTLRMAMTAIRNEEVAGEAARELTNDEVLAVLGREAKRRREAADAYEQAGRAELTQRERAELEVIEAYLPEQLDDAELTALVSDAIAETGATTPKQMGQVMRVALAKTEGRADGARVAALVRERLTGS